jgi:hypothetical protein
VIPPPISPAEHAGEQLAIVSERSISMPEAQNLAILETAYFKYFVVNSPPAPPGSANANITLPANVVGGSGSSGSGCVTAFSRKRSAVEEWTGFDLQPRAGCKVINRLDIDIHFNYIKPKTSSSRPYDLEARVRKNVEFLQTIYNPMGIYFNYVKNEVWWWKPTGANDDWSIVNKGEDKLRRWQMKTRELGKMVLTVWLVNDLRGADGTNTINGVSSFSLLCLSPSCGPFSFFSFFLLNRDVSYSMPRSRTTSKRYRRTTESS